MAVSLKLVPQQEEDRTIEVLKIINNEKNSEVNVTLANNEGITLDEATFKRLQTLVTLGQRYEEIIKSQKSEFLDI